MSRILMAVLLAAVGYVVCAVAGYFLVMALSSNRQDKPLEAAMTAAFFFGPLGAIVAAILALLKAI